MSNDAKESVLSIDGVNMALATTLVSTLASLGVTDAVISPGSRSTPMAVATNREARIALHVKLDERSAGFYALGISKVSLRPTLLITTSGTAATELRPAITEAFHSKIPLLVATSDRPPELQGIASPQTISQIALFDDVCNSKILFSAPSVADIRVWTSLAAQAFASATDEFLGAGPVHMNLPFAEPLYDQEEGESEALEALLAKTVVSRTYKKRGVIPLEIVEEEINPKKRGLIVAGGRSFVSEATLCRISELLGWPVLIDHRFGAKNKGVTFVRGGDLLLRSKVFAEKAVPNVILKVGEPQASKVVSEFLSRSSISRGGCATTVALLPPGVRVDPGRDTSVFLDGDPEATLISWCNAIESMENQEKDGSWIELWQKGERSVQGVLDADLEQARRSSLPLGEAHLAREVVSQLTSNDMLFVSSSMPIRDVEFFADMKDNTVSVLANRGANGIDGVISSFFGASYAWSRQRSKSLSVLLIGDLAFLYDLTALLYSKGQGGVIFVTDNKGGAIFSFLSQHERLERGEFERLFGTPQGIDLRSVIGGMDIEVDTLNSLSDIERVLSLSRDNPSKVFVGLVSSDREANLKEHNRLYALAAGEIDRTFG